MPWCFCHSTSLPSLPHVTTDFSHIPVKHRSIRILPRKGSVREGLPSFSDHLSKKWLNWLEWVSLKLERGRKQLFSACWGFLISFVGALITAPELQQSSKGFNSFNQGSCFFTYFSFCLHWPRYTVTTFRPTITIAKRKKCAWCYGN